MDLATLRDELTCPVCLEIPRTGDLFQCHNGHVICQTDFNKLLGATIGAKCPECMAHYGSDPIRSRFAEKFLDCVQIPCRYTDKGCQVELTRKHIKEHEEEKCNFGLKPCRYLNYGCAKLCTVERLVEHEVNCSFRSRPCRYHVNGCQAKVSAAKDDDFARKHEDGCEFQPYPCLVMSCTHKLPYSRILVHLKCDHKIDSRDETETKSGNEGEFSRAFDIGLTMPVPWSPQWLQLKGTVIKFDDHHFYLGLTKIEDRWTVSVHLVGKPSELSNYMVKIIAENPKNKSQFVTYGGPLNSLVVAGKVGFEKEHVGLSFPDRIAQALIHQHVYKRKNVLRVVCSIIKGKYF